METVVVKYEGQEETFEGEDEYDALCDAKEWLQAEAWENSRHLEEEGQFLKPIVCVEGGEPKEAEFYRRLEGTGITPKFLGSGKLFSFEIIRKRTGKVSKQQYSYVLLERFGKALDKMYPPTDGMISSELLLEDPEHFDNVFPSQIFPDSLKQKIRQLLENLSSHGIEHQDLHTGNILTDGETNLKLIDFQYAAFL